jgi:hypothetical protein
MKSPAEAGRSHGEFRPMADDGVSLFLPRVSSMASAERGGHSPAPKCPRQRTTGKRTPSSCFGLEAEYAQSGEQHVA